MKIVITCENENDTFGYRVKDDELILTVKLECIENPMTGPKIEVNKYNPERKDSCCCSVCSHGEKKSEREQIEEIQDKNKLLEKSLLSIIDANRIMLYEIERLQKHLRYKQ